MLIWFFFLAACRDVAPDLAKPESNRFDKVVLAEGLDEPMQFEILDDGRVLFVERKGAIKCYDPRTKHTELLAQVPVRHTFIKGDGFEESEDGIQGILLDPAFEENGWVYIYYAPLEGPPRNSLVRLHWDGGAMDLSEADILLEIPVAPDICCHVGGGMVFDTAGNLLLATGENAQLGAPFSTIDERPGRETRDSQRSSANTADLRGKILRIRPEPDGTYSIPEGNLFPPGTPKTRPEIYTMGNRNPWRLSVDSKTNWVYWGEVGPSGGEDVEGIGPRTYDEFNQAREPGNYGYPYTIGNNFAYWKYDFETDTSGERFDPLRLVNRSPNNTGLEELPPSKPAFIWYPYANSEEFPELGSGGSSAVGGPIYRQSDFDNPARPFPAYYEGKWFITDWVRGWIMAVTMDEKGDYQSMEELIPGLSLNGAIDMDFGPDGDLYVLEYGSNGTFKGNPDARLIRIEYNDGNRKPVVQLSADKTAGAVPFTVTLSSEGTLDYDKDPLTYDWTITSPGKPTRTLTGATVSVPFTEAGIYTATLVVDDSHGAQGKRDIRIIAGNEPPQVEWDLRGGNRSFFFPNSTLSYAVNIRDREDDLSTDGPPDPRRTEISIDYLLEGNIVTRSIPSSAAPILPAAVLTGTRPVPQGAEQPYPAVLGLLVEKNNCRTCHQVANRSLGPGFLEIAERYRKDADATHRLAKKIIKGGSGVWGEAAMPAHPILPVMDAVTIAEYILGFTRDGGNQRQALPLSGTVAIDPIKEQDRRGVFVLRAAYTDAGGVEDAPPLQAEQILLLKDPYVPASQVDQLHQSEFNRAINLDRSDITMDAPGAWLRLNQIDLTNIGELRIVASAFFPEASDTKPAGTILEIRIDSSEGQLIGKTADTALAAGQPIIQQVDIVEGMHDVFLVFSSLHTGSPPGKIRVRGIEFRERKEEP